VKQVVEDADREENVNILIWFEVEVTS